MAQTSALLKHIIILISSISAITLNASTPDSLNLYHSKPSHQIGFDLRSGWIAPNKDFFKGENAREKRLDKTVSAYLKYAFSFAPDSRFGRMFPNTYQGIGVGYHNFFDTDEIGNPLSVYVMQGSRIAQISQNLSLDYEWNFGASFGWKKFDEETNPFNTVVGSRANAFINLGIMLNWQFAHNWNLLAGIDIAHFSNGNTSHPNASVNTFGARIGLVRKFMPHGINATSSLPRINITPHFSYDLVLYCATRKRGILTDDDRFMVPGSFAILGMNFNPMYNFNNFFCAGASLDMQFDESANIKDHIASPDGSTSGESTQFYKPPFRERFATGLSLRAELIMPIFSINIGIGHNVIYKGSDNDGFYQIVALKTHLSKSFFIHVGYRFIDFRDPSNLMLGIGYRFHNKR